MRTFRCSSSGMRRSDIWVGDVIPEAPLGWPSALHGALPGRAVSAITSPPGLREPRDRPPVSYALTSCRMRNYGLPAEGGTRERRDGQREIGGAWTAKRGNS